MGPESGGEPGVQHIGVLDDILGAALAAPIRVLHGHRYPLAFPAVPDGDAVAPPELAADAPVPEVLHPVEIDLDEVLRDDADAPLFHRLDGGLGQGLHLYEPLL